MKIIQLPFKRPFRISGLRLSFRQSCPVFGRIPEIISAEFSGRTSGKFFSSRSFIDWLTFGLIVKGCAFWVDWLIAGPIFSVETQSAVSMLLLSKFGSRQWPAVIDWLNGIHFLLKTLVFWLIDWLIFFLQAALWGGDGLRDLPAHLAVHHLQGPVGAPLPLHHRHQGD